MAENRAYCPGRAVSANATVPPFLALPPEIRLKIYGLVFEGGMIHVDAPNSCRCAACCLSKRKTDHRILPASRPCRDEGLSVLLSSTLWIFRFPASSSLESFICHSRSSEGSKVVKYISVDLLLLEGQSSFARLPSLKELIVPTDGLAHLKSLARGDSDALSDENIVHTIHTYMLKREPFLPLARLLAEPRTCSLSLVVKLEFLRPGKMLPYRWQDTVCTSLFPGVRWLIG
jgi:hypothetical protein